MIFLRADTSGDGGEDVVFANLGGGAEEVADYDQFDEFFYLHADGAVVGASGLGAFQAAARFLLSKFWAVAEIHFRKVVGALLCGLLGHQLARNLDALLHGQGV